MSTTCLLIRNPVARHAIDQHRLARVLEVAIAAGWQIDTVATEYANHATELARDAALRGVDVVIVHGGDGTVNEALNGLVGSKTALGVLRGGTANVWAKETSCRKDPVASMRELVSGQRRAVDLGRAGERYYLLMAGVGFDAAIIPRVSSSLKRRIGALSYVIAGVGTFFRYRERMVRLRIDDRDPADTSLYWMLVGNTRNYGGLVNITDRAIADDGLLDVALMHRGGLWRLLTDGVRLLFRRHHGSKNVTYTRVSSVEIETPGLLVQLDGELCGETPMRIGVEPGALHVIVPRRLSTPLFMSEVLPG